jgi:transposase-like protein
VKGIPRGRYTKEFLKEAVKLVTEEKLSWSEAGRRLSLAPSTIGSWVNAYKSGKLGEIGKRYQPLTEVEMELARTKKELAEVRMERDILKKQPRTLLRSRCPVRDDERTATPIPGATDGADDELVSQRILCLAGPAVVEASPGGNAFGT